MQIISRDPGADPKSGLWFLLSLVLMLWNRLYMESPAHPGPLPLLPVLCPHWGLNQGPSASPLSPPHRLGYHCPYMDFSGKNGKKSPCQSSAECPLGVLSMH